LGIIMTIFRPVWRVLRFALKPILWLVSMAWRGLMALFSLGGSVGGSVGGSEGKRPARQDAEPDKTVADEAIPATDSASPSDD
jgi:hypothetical protein